MGDRNEQNDRSSENSGEPITRAENPYEDVAIETLPEWWSEAIREFEEAEVRAYQPSQFRDGVLVESLLSRLQSTYDVSITVVGDDVEYGDQWSLVVDGTTVAEFEHQRSSDGFSVFGIESEQVVELVESSVESD